MIVVHMSLLLDPDLLESDAHSPPIYRPPTFSGKVIPAWSPRKTVLNHASPEPMEHDAWFP